MSSHRTDQRCPYIQVRLGIVSLKLSEQAGPVNRPYAYDVIISLRPHLGDIGLRVNAVVSDVPAAVHKRVQDNGFYPQHGSAMMSMHKVN